MSLPSFKQYLVEEEREVFFTFGRMNPPTTGHGKLMSVLSTKAGRNPYKVFLSQSQDANKNPLSYSQKIKHARKMFPQHARNILMDKKVKTVFDVATRLHNEGYTKVNMVVGADRITEFQTLLNKYNGVKGRHGFYNFQKINVISAGDRDPDADDVTGMSASKQRANAKENDFTSFSQGVPAKMSDKDTRKLFNDIRTGMGLRESKSFKHHVTLEKVSETREKYIEGGLFSEGDQVRIRSGKTGTIHRLGSNYVIVALDEGRIARCWLDDVELVESERPASPATGIHDRWYKEQPEWGTPESTKRAKKFTPGQVEEEDEVGIVRKNIERDTERSKQRYDRMLDRARLARARRRNRETTARPSPRQEATYDRPWPPAGNPVAKNMNKFNKPATHKDKKKDAKRGYQKHKGQLNGGN